MAGRWIIALGAFVGGLAAGLLYAPKTGSRWLREQVRETQANILRAGDDASVRLRKAAGRAVDKLMPESGADDAARQEVHTQKAKDVEDEKR